MTKTLNYSLMDTDFLAGFNSCLDSILSLAGYEVALKEATDEAKKYYSDKKDISNYTKQERRDVSNAKQVATDKCTLLLGRYVSVADMFDIYHFDVEAFLTNIGVIAGEGNLKKGALHKVEALRNEVVDRVRVSITRRTKGTDYLTHGEAKQVQNNSIDVILALKEAFLDSTCFEMSSYGLVKVDFEAKQEAGNDEA